jgi:nitrate/nitrite transporter NarK
MLVEAAGDKPGRAIGVNGVFGNLGVALAPVVTAFLANGRLARRLHRARPAVRAVPGCCGCAPRWRRRACRRRPFPPIPRHLVRRAVLVLLLIAMSSGLVFNAFTLLLPKLMQERLAGNATLLPLVGARRLPGDAVRRADPVHRRADDRPQHAEAGVPAGQHRAGAGDGWRLSFAQGWLVLPLAALVAASIFGQVTVNETMAARYISPELRARIYSVRFFVGFLGAAAAAPVVSPCCTNAPAAWPL